jgi:hypothetical protein
MSRRTKVPLLIQKRSGKNNRSDERSPPGAELPAAHWTFHEASKISTGELQKTKILGLNIAKDFMRTSR